MKILTIAANKGGVGKTTLSSLIACEAIKYGLEVFIIDTDPQQSLKRWWEKRVDEKIKYIDAEKKRLVDLPSNIKKTPGLLIIDTPPSHLKIIEDAIKLADYILIPCRPSPLDIEAIGETITVVEELKKNFAFVINSAISGTKVTEQALLLLSRYGPIAPSIIRQRTVYATSMTDGRSALEMNNKLVKEESNILWNFLTKKMRLNNG